MTGLADGLESLKGASPGTVCNLCSFLADLDPEDAAALRARVDDTSRDRLSARVLAEYLRQFGGPKEASIGRHRRDGHA